MQFSADVLVIIESCQAAALALSSRDEKKREGRLEVIAASTYPDVTWPGQESFNSALCEALIELAGRGNTFTTATLYHEILLQVFEILYVKKRQYRLRYPPYRNGEPYVPSSPIHLNLTGDSQLSLIQLNPLGPEALEYFLRQTRPEVDLFMEDFDFDQPWLEGDDFLRRNRN